MNNEAGGTNPPNPLSPTEAVVLGLLRAHIPCKKMGDCCAKKPVEDYEKRRSEPNIAFETSVSHIVDQNTVACKQRGQILETLREIRHEIEKNAIPVQRPASPVTEQALVKLWRGDPPNTGGM